MLRAQNSERLGDSAGCTRPHFHFGVGVSNRYQDMDLRSVENAYYRHRHPRPAAFTNKRVGRTDVISANMVKRGVSFLTSKDDPQERRAEPAALSIDTPPRPKSSRRTSAQCFWSHVQKTDNCWLWRGFTTEQGYGRLKVKRKPKLAHRYSWELTHGPIEDPKMCVCHKCDVRLCVNPEHLFLGTLAQNNEDRDRKRGLGRMARVFGWHDPDVFSLTKRDVLAIREDYRSIDVIAANYGLRRATISMIKTGQLLSQMP